MKPLLALIVLSLLVISPTLQMGLSQVPSAKATRSQSPDLPSVSPPGTLESDLATTLRGAVASLSPSETSPAAQITSSVTYTSLTYNGQISFSYTTYPLPEYFQGTSQATFTVTINQPNPDLSQIIGFFSDGQGTFSGTYYKSGVENCPSTISISGTYTLTGWGEYENGFPNSLNFSVGTTNFVEKASASSDCFVDPSADISNIIGDCGLGGGDYSNEACVNFPVAGGSHAIANGAYDLYPSLTGAAEVTLVSSTTLTTTSTTSTSTSVSCSPSTVQVGATTKCTATVTGSNPTGSVTWTSSTAGTFSPASCTLLSGSCSTTYSPSSSGSPVITASYGGDAANGASSGTFTLTVSSSGATAVVVTCADTTIEVTTTTSCTVTVTGSSPTGVASWSISGGGTFSSSTCTLVSGSCSVTFSATAVGSWVITVVYGGDSKNSESTGTLDIEVILIQCPQPQFRVKLLGVRTQGAAVNGYQSTVLSTDTLIIDGEFFQDTVPQAGSVCSYSVSVTVTVTITGADGIPYQYTAPVLSSLGTQPIPAVPTTWVTLQAPPTPRPLGTWQMVARADVTVTNQDPSTDLYGTNNFGPYYSDYLYFVVLSQKPSLTIRATTPDGSTVSFYAYGNITGNVNGKLVYTQCPLTVPEGPCQYTEVLGKGLPTLEFNVTGASGTYGYMTVVIPKSVVGYGLSPAVIVGNANTPPTPGVKWTRLPFGYNNACPPLSSASPPPATTQCIAAWPFTQDNNNYYIRIYMHFSTDQLGVVFGPQPFTNGQSASVVLGQASFTTSASSTTQNGLSNPKGMVFDSSGDLWLVDKGNNRVLEFKPPFTTQMAASVVIGQPSFTSNTASTSQSGLSSPYGIAIDGSGDLWVVDSFNDRVLEFKPPFSTGMSASLVIGQASFATNAYVTTQNGLAFPTAAAFDSSGDLWVVDSDNSRILEFTPPFSNGMAASLVLGQQSFTTYDVATTTTGLAYPSGMAFDSFGNLWVTDTYNSRAVGYSPPFKTGMAATFVVGLPSLTSLPPDTCSTSQSVLCVPTGIAVDQSNDLWVLDSMNNRTVEFTPQITNGAAASVVIGQSDFTTSKGGTSATTLLTETSSAFYITSLAFDPAGNLWIADSGNNRVLEYVANTTLPASDLISDSGNLAYSVSAAGKQYAVGLATNSSVSSFSYDSQNKLISFSVSGASGTKGFVNATWPKAMMDGSFALYLDGKLVASTLKQNATNYFLYASYTHSQHSVVIRTEEPLTMGYQVVGGGSGYSPPTLTYTSGGAQTTVSLATGSASYAADYGTTWTVTGTLPGSSQTERWVTSQTTSGTATTPQTLSLTYYHQYLLAVQATPSNAGTVSPNGGWYNSSTSLSISATPNAGWQFAGWTGSGTGSYAGTNNPASITMSGPITETANFSPLTATTSTTTTSTTTTSSTATASTTSSTTATSSTASTTTTTSTQTTTASPTSSSTSIVASTTSTATTSSTSSVTPTTTTSSSSTLSPTSSASSSTTTSSSTTSVSPTVSSATTTGGGGGIPEFPYQSALALAFALTLVGLYLVARRRR